MGKTTARITVSILTNTLVFPEAQTDQDSFNEVAYESQRWTTKYPFVRAIVLWQMWCTVSTEMGHRKRCPRRPKSGRVKVVELAKNVLTDYRI